MERYHLFKEYIASAVERFKQIPKNETIKVVSHFDCDGIASASIMIKALRNEDRPYSISIIKGLDAKAIEAIANEQYKYVIVTDLGSGQLKLIKEKLSDKEVLILDHHNPEDTKLGGNITHINPNLFAIDGGKEISGAGVVYLFAAALNPKNEKMAHIAIIGAIGDMQENNGFLHLNGEIMQTAIHCGKLRVTKGLKFFGNQTRPLHKILEYSSNPYIPGVSGSESGAIKFLQNLDIDPKSSKGWKKLAQLSKDEMEKLIVAIITSSKQENLHEEIVGNVYTLIEEEDESPLKDGREYSTLLNACGRMDKSILGIGCCLNDKKLKQEAINQVQLYKREIINALTWYDMNKNSKNVIIHEKFLIINSQDSIPPAIIGTVASIISKSREFPEGTYILSLAKTTDDKIKISLRVSGYKMDIDLREILLDIIKETGGETGGHRYAAGAVIDVGAEDHFIEVAKKRLKCQKESR